ncbi:CYTH domain-containing protein [Croceivirga thetidis]|uniref:CYTH domain-containing protein n=1 Tax=Croceivirga thetidis TaxID=2721623 RepID=A0ABX1GP79_9FLAO|nr:CYTH domain-containing protein [Croceivirga thetidis]NKI31384.1 CYTH domain-containing protein [Croceivirga thetidis]
MGNLEIERKFLVASKAYRSEAISEIRIIQGFLNTDPERTVRIRIKGDQGYLTVKGIGNDSGTTRFEWEKEISVTEASDLIKLCEPIILDKIRFVVPVGHHHFEVDEFKGENEGLVLAEIELEHEDEQFNKPKWLGAEVTGQVRYYNSQLSKVPFGQWED